MKVCKVQYDSNYGRIHPPYSPSFIISKSTKKAIDNALDSKEVLESIPNGVTAYISKTSAIPRFKVKDYFLTNRITKEKLKPTTEVVILNRSIDNLRDRKETEAYYFIPKALIDHSLLLQILTIPKLIYSCEGLVVHKKYHGNNLQKILTKLNIPLGTKIDLEDFVELYNEQENIEYEDLVNIALNPVCKLIYDENVLPELNKDGMVIDLETMRNIDLMLKSKDRGDKKLAFEVMSNSNYQNSHVAVSILLADNWNVISQSDYKKMWNVNFNSLLTYLTDMNVEFTKDWKSLAKTLTASCKDEAQKTEVKQFVLEKLTQELQSYSIVVKEIDIQV